MKNEIQKLIDAGFTVEELLDALKAFRDDQQVRCEHCNRRLCDFDNGTVVIKCKCGELKKII